ncbi:hypothetical protein [Clostridium botulinum]|nr:hypothetical protein [Clostridium botulinum]APH21048.1 hypothetical protein NPD1_4253 [Clostridium botulinum]APQ71141.1 hypothetical protein RSJ8_4210 [Clostridium botulinum]APR02346.1 hypothetical protein RSJ2_4072 [Clostridium botulinum]
MNKRELIASKIMMISYIYKECLIRMDIETLKELYKRLRKRW